MRSIRPGFLASLAAMGAVAGSVWRAWAHAREQILRELQEQRSETAGSDDLVKLERRLRRARRNDFQQIEALLNLHAMLPVRYRMPPSRFDWALSPDMLLLLVALIQERRPGTVVELGSGVSTAWMALALRELSIEGRLVSLDHLTRFADATRGRLVAFGLQAHAEVRHAPLVGLELDGETYPWYDRDALADIHTCDLLVVDGPPGHLRPRSRYPAMPMLGDRMTPGSHVVADDYNRPAERAMVARWMDLFPGWTLRELPLEKGAALLTRRV